MFSKNVIGQDQWSVVLTFFALSILLFYNLFPTSLQQDSIIAVTLMLGGLAMSSFLKYQREVDDYTDKQERNILVYAALGLVVIFAANLYVPDILHYVNTTADYDALTTIGIASPLFLVILVPVSEEQFNRAAWGNFLIQKAGLFVGMIAGGAEFTIYHFLTYGFNTDALGIIFAAGVILIYIDAKTGTVTTSMIAHIANNAFSYFQLQSIAPPSVTSMVAPILSSPLVSIAAVGGVLTFAFVTQFPKLVPKAFIGTLVNSGQSE